MHIKSAEVLARLVTVLEHPRQMIDSHGFAKLEWVIAMMLTSEMDLEGRPTVHGRSRDLLVLSWPLRFARVARVSKVYVQGALYITVSPGQDLTRFFQTATRNHRDEVRHDDNNAST